MLNLTRALGANNDSYNDIIDVINFEIKLAQVCTISECNSFHAPFFWRWRKGRIYDDCGQRVLFCNKCIWELSQLSNKRRFGDNQERFYLLYSILYAAKNYRRLVSQYSLVNKTKSDDNTQRKCTSNQIEFWNKNFEMTCDVC